MSSHFISTLNYTNEPKSRMVPVFSYSVIGNGQLFGGVVNHVLHPTINGQLAHLDLGGAKRNCDIGLRSMFIFSNGEWLPVSSWAVRSVTFTGKV
jgi:hypothetical protein